MSLNDTPQSQRVHIGFFGRRNAGKSSIVNAITNQQVSVVSDVKGTTTDPVTKAMELLPLGPVVIIDTPGFDDEGSLGEMRVKRTREVLNRVDIAVLVVDSVEGLSKSDSELIDIFKKKLVPYLIVYNKCDISDNAQYSDGISVSAVNNTNINLLKEKIAQLANNESSDKKICSDLIKANDFIVLVIPIDASAPKGRLILPQQQTIREILDSKAVAIAVKETELEATLSSLGKKPAMVITDSQVFAQVSKIVPKDIPLTSFSILMARYKGFLNTAVNGAKAIDSLQDGDKILISEGCTHHRQCNDIGTVKLPALLKKYTGKNLIIETSSGKSFPEDLSKYNLVIHCGGCMLNEREMKYRRSVAQDYTIPFTNYGTAIAYMNGILIRSLSVFDEL
ncbi:MAG: [FeFe] hydrogenase H-cluster maturation GTPase HydF [Ruminococcus sp.]|nr:[FeFe] hydrogenase H-cluster maturation GTPase HydF [Ruminococcus sp.]